jgi:hypothetical protein
MRALCDVFCLEKKEKDLCDALCLANQFFLFLSNVHFYSNVIFFNLFYVVIFIVECNELQCNIML